MRKNCIDKAAKIVNRINKNLKEGKKVRSRDQTKLGKIINKHNIDIELVIFRARHLREIGR